MKKYLRPIIYVGLFVFLLISIILKRDIIVAKRAVEAVSIPTEIAKHGWPVDIQEVGPVQLSTSTRVTVHRVGAGAGSFYVADELRRQLRSGTPVLDITSNKVLGQITQVAGARDYRTGLYRVDIAFEDQAGLDQKLQKQSDFTVAIELKQSNRALAVPIQAIRTNDEKKSYVWVLNSELKPEKRLVRTGLINTVKAEIIDGLKAGEQVIVEGYNGIEDQEKIRVRRTYLVDGSVKQGVSL